MDRWRAQRDVWGLVAGATIALGLVCALMMWGLAVTLAASMAFFVPAFSAALLVEKGGWASTRIGVMSGLVLVACSGLLAAFQWWGALLIVTVTVTSPAVRMLLRLWLRRGDPLKEAVASGDYRRLDDLQMAPRGSADGSVITRAPLPDIPGALGVPGLDDDALCDAWRRSYVRLGASRAADARLEVVRLRQLYLDELVRRHPVEVQKWLASGARAAGNPLPYLKRPGRRRGSAEDGRPDTGSTDLS